MKKIVLSLVSVILALCMACGVAGCSGVTEVDPNAYSYITIDINPSVEILTLGNNVIDVKAANYDACVLLAGEDFYNYTLEKATQKIVALADEMGYLTDANNQVKISVISDDAKTVEILKSMAKSGAEKGSKKAAPVAATRLQDELTVKKLKEENPDKFADITEEKVRLIESIMQYDSTLTYETGAEMSVKELSAILKTLNNENKEIFTSELRAEYSARYVESKHEIEREISSFYGEEYLEKWEIYTSLENVYNAIVTALDKSGMSEEDVENVVGLLGITDLNLITKGGIVKPDYVLSYIDKYVNKKSAQTKSVIEEVVAILDRYDVKNHELTAGEKEIIYQAIGENEYTILSEISYKLSVLKNELNSIKSEVELTEDEIAQIRDLNESFATVKDRVLEEMSDIIATVRAEILAEKQQRTNA